MKEYRVTAHITICMEMDVMADNVEDAIDEYVKSMNNEYGWVDVEGIKVQQLGGGQDE